MTITDDLTDRAPTSVSGFHTRLRELSPRLPKRLYQCASYLEQNPNVVAFSTVADIAAAAGVQPSALMRFCKIMGFSGFTEMQKLFRESLATGVPNYSERLKDLRDEGGDSPGALLAEFIESGRMSLEDLTKQVDFDVLDAAVEALSRARVIHLIGLRRAFPIASYMCYALEKMNIPAFLHSGLGKLDHSQVMDSSDALVAITFAPYSPETVTLSKLAAERSVPVVSITDSPSSPVHGPDTYSLLVSEVDFGAFRSLSASLTLAIALSVSVGLRRDSTG
ncbi:MAG: MurR/RpiR family transcriptional regulator [Pseudomonadota bacterium]